MEHYGPQGRTVSGPCLTASRGRARSRGIPCGAGPGTSPRERAGSEARRLAASAPSAEATGATAVPAAEPVADETARILAERSPEKWLQYTLWEARRYRRDANETAGNQLAADGNTAAARQRNVVANEAAQGRWAAEAAALIAEYARVIGAQPPATGDGADDGTSPYNHGWDNGHRMIEAGITRRPGGYDDGQWREYVAGYAAGFRHAARSAVFTAETVSEQAQKDHEGSAPEVIQIPLSAEWRPIKPAKRQVRSDRPLVRANWPEPAPKRAPGELTEGQGRIRLHRVPADRRPRFPAQPGKRCPEPHNPTPRATSQPNGPSSPRRRTP